MPLPDELSECFRWLGVTVDDIKVGLLGACAIQKAWATIRPRVHVFTLALCPVSASPCYSEK